MTTSNTNCAAIATTAKCVTSDGVEDACSVCAAGYTENAGACDFTVDDCNAVDSDGVCTGCATGTNTAANNSCEVTIDQCAVYNVADPTTCDKCDVTHFGDCSTSGVANCDTGTETAVGVCSQCLPGHVYTDASTDTCVAGLVTDCINYEGGNVTTNASACIECTQGFSLDDGATCTEIDTNCVASNATTSADVCTKCDTLFFIATNTSVCSPLT
ncbi:MAG: hypothetical protein JKY09_00495 [Crocinitomicaceae bacterium]|nr:hypothetical protein [Crocinitomicaceae bacterium]